MKKSIKKGAIIAMMLSIALIALVAMTAPDAEALPNYTTAIGEACGVCHVNPAGGGTRTALGEAFFQIPTHASDPVGAWAQVTAPPAEICDDTIDNDEDGMVDCDDQDCNLDPACEVVAVPEVCDDGMDNDLDGFIDCSDPDCATDPACEQLPETETNCTDGLDEDGDGAIDCADDDCAAAPSCQEPDPVCGNGIIEADEECDDNTVSCVNCMIVVVEPPTGNLPADHTDEEDGFFHGNAGKDRPFTNGCTACHGDDLRGIQGFTPSCFQCHGKEWDEDGPGGVDTGAPAGHTDEEDGFFHMPGKDRPFTNGCTACHGDDLRGIPGVGPSCFTCHGMEWDEGRAGGGGHDDSDSDSDDGDSRRRSSDSDSDSD